jgi:hypothetical protein
VAIATPEISRKLFSLIGWYASRDAIAAEEPTAGVDVQTK